MLSVSAFDVLYEHVRAFDDSTPAHLGSVLWTVAGNPVSLTTRSRKQNRVLKAFLQSGGGVELVVTFRVERGWFRNAVVADVEIDGRKSARRMTTALELKHSFDRDAIAKLIANLERQATQLERRTSPAIESLSIDGRAYGA